MVHLESEAEVACPAESAHEYVAGVFRCRAVKSELEKRRAEHVGACPEFCVELFFAIFEFSLGCVGFRGPVAVELCQIILAVGEMEHRGCVFLYFNRLVLSVCYLGV